MMTYLVLVVILIFIMLSSNQGEASQGVHNHKQAQEAGPSQISKETSEKEGQD